MAFIYTYLCKKANLTFLLEVTPTLIALLAHPQKHWTAIIAATHGALERGRLESGLWYMCSVHLEWALVHVLCTRAFWFLESREISINNRC